jgi:hypothetical protein
VLGCWHICQPHIVDTLDTSASAPSLSRSPRC